ncbi:hypothetical protein [Paenibacillus cymbidii]|uniref:hypothetical protein n=1 Tax=Paenibacillus cymbidii TaxID=1639034 RepID=UPI001081DC7F|nr:hypothetical protein [Paenibacillus cymbidii]
MNVAKLMNAIFETLTSDAALMALLGLTPSSQPLDKERRIVKGYESDTPLTPAVVPRLYIAIKPGRFGANPYAFEGKFCVEILHKTQSGAMEIAESVQRLFHGKYIAYGDFRSLSRCYLASANDFATSVTGIRGHEVYYDVDYFVGME